MREMDILKNRNDATRRNVRCTRCGRLILTTERFYRTGHKKNGRNQNRALGFRNFCEDCYEAKLVDA